ncbi:MAG: LPS export ABC transporter periplasmic protein LptC [SAR86 cluster bacterium]|uniref:LPS export ABC transporter periplasmic protein LptC n=1 Tax=SAR86 cluster bacterium TaxID=2030880 RepID=A0A2A5AQG5_9GAMM|nr:MAG: LPS export ABC transporter periplasmic protein LptC [SAR86 cluster bacterium]
MQRITLLIVPGLIVIALFVGISNIDSIVTPTESNSELQTLDFSAYSEGINTILYNIEGQINYTLQATRQIHYNNNVTELSEPFIKLYENGDSRWNIVADSGKISAIESENNTSTQIIELTGNVEVYSLDEFGNRVLLSTEFLTLDPQLEILKTDVAVTFVTQTLKQTSMGMIGNLKLDEFTFFSDIRGSYEQATN